MDFTDVKRKEKDDTICREANDADASAPTSCTETAGGLGKDSDLRRPPGCVCGGGDDDDDDEVIEQGKGKSAATAPEAGRNDQGCGLPVEGDEGVQVAEDDAELPEILSKKQQRAAQRARGDRKRGSARGEQKQNGGHRQDSKAAGTCDDPFEVLVIGAGPHALSMVLRLVEPCPDMLTDGERILEGLHTRHGVWSETKHHVTALRRGKIGQAGVAKERPTINDINQGTNSTYASFQQTPHVPLRTLRDSVHVIDAHGEWMREWDRNFQAYEIKYLRSSVYVHPDPYQQRTLSSYADVYKKEHEQRAYNHITRGSDPNPANDDYHGPFKAPSTRLFAEFCNELIKGYGVDGMVHKGRAVDLSRCGDSGLFRVQLDDGGQELWARRVVCALGPNLREEPLFFQHSVGPHPPERMVKASELTRWLLDMQEGGWERAKGWRVLIVGGGLTSAHLVNLAVANGLGHATLVTRSQMRSRQFDIDAKWVGPSRGELYKEFKSQPPKGRIATNFKARQGGSMPPEIHEELQAHADAGRVEILQDTEVSKASWHGSDQGGHWVVELGGRSVECDVMWLSTGGVIELSEYPILRSFACKEPIQIAGGLPVLRDDLSWGEDCPLYVMGALAQLQLGPDALNLAGGRHGAVRVASAIRQDIAMSMAPDKK